MQPAVVLCEAPRRLRTEYRTGLSDPDGHTGFWLLVAAPTQVLAPVLTSLCSVPGHGNVAPNATVPPTGRVG
jgi:hypothetical protein